MHTYYVNTEWRAELVLRKDCKSIFDTLSPCFCRPVPNFILYESVNQTLLLNSQQKLIRYKTKIVI